MLLIRNAPRRTAAAGKVVALALMIFVTVSCGNDPGQHVYTQTVAPSAVTAVSTEQPAAANPDLAVVNPPQTAKPAVVATVITDSPAPVPAYGSSSYHPAPYFYGPVGGILPTGH